MKKNLATRFEGDNRPRSSLIAIYTYTPNNNTERDTLRFSLREIHGENNNIRHSRRDCL